MKYLSTFDFVVFHHGFQFFVGGFPLFLGGIYELLAYRAPSPDLGFASPLDSLHPWWQIAIILIGAYNICSAWRQASRLRNGISD